METKNNILTDEQLKELLQGTKLKASENLQYRIMHQIDMEKTLTYKKVKSEKPLLKSMLGIAAVFYVLILALSIATYYLKGFEAFASKEFLLSAAALSSACAIYGLIIVLDEKRYLK